MNNVLFGERMNDAGDAIEDTGFIGIDLEVELGLPKDILGDMIKNLGGIYAHVIINTIDNNYGLDFGIMIKRIGAEVNLAFKETEVKGQSVILPDRIAFYIRDGLKIPLYPPLFMTGLGGGLSNLADTFSGQFETLPPITLDLYTRLELIETMIGDFTLRANLSGLQLDGDMKFKYASDGFFDLKAGISARWIDPWNLSLYGEVNVLDGLLHGTLKILISEDFFGGYAAIAVCIPDEVPVIGGKEIGGLEFAVNNKFIGGNFRIIGITFGVIYYWNGDFDYGEGIDLELFEDAYPEALAVVPGSVEGGLRYVAVYGNNFHRLSVSEGLTLMDGGSRQLIVEKPSAEDAILFNTEYMGTGTPKLSDLTFTVNGTAYPLTPDDGAGNGNCLIQRRSDGTFIYISARDLASLPDNSVFEISCSSGSLGPIKAAGADDTPKLTNVTFNHASETSRTVDVSWNVTKALTVNSTVDVYLTETPNAVSTVTENSSGDPEAFGFRLAHLDTAAIQDGSCQIEIPESFASGDYYVLVMIGSDAGGMTTYQTAGTLRYTNTDLPQPIRSAALSYAGNGEFRLQIEDAAAIDYTDYMVELESMDGSPVSNALFQIGVDNDGIVFGSTMGLIPGTAYRAKIITVRENEEQIFYGDQPVYTAYAALPAQSKPALVSVSSNVQNGYLTEETLTAEYTFDKPVILTIELNDESITLNDTNAAGQYITATSFRFERQLPDGEYLVHFTALNPTSLDSVNSLDLYAAQPEAVLSVVVDTEAPILELDQTRMETLAETSALFGGNTVFANEDGSYEILGITEHNIRLTVDGSSSGFTLEQGRFSVSGTLPYEELTRDVILSAVDPAGNATEAVVTVVNSSLKFKGIEAQIDGKAYHRGDVLELALGEVKQLRVFAVIETKNGESLIPLDPAEVKWELFGERNIVSLTETGEAYISLSADMEGETVLGFNYGGADVESGATVSFGTEDFLRIKVGSSKLPAAPVGITIQGASGQYVADGIMLGTTDAMEYDTTPSFRGPKRCGSGQTPGLAPGIYYVRYAATPGSPASMAATVVIPVITMPGRPGTGTGTETDGPVQIRTETGGNGSISLSAETVQRGGSVTVAILPNEGYLLDEVRINGKTVPTHGRFTLKAVNEDTLIEAVFLKKTAAEDWVNPFKDIRESDWFYADVSYACRSRWMNGVDADLFDPKASLTRATFVTVLYRFELQPEAGTNPFGDVARGSWYEEPVAWASGAGIVKGVGDNTFAPNQPITREQMATMLYRYMQYRGLDVSAWNQTDLSGFEDADKISAYAAEAMRWAVGCGLFRGRTDTELAPGGIATRAEIATVFRRLEDQISGS